MNHSNWEQGKEQSDFHFDWKRHETGGHDYKWLARFEGDWSKELEVIKETAQPKTWASRGKNYHKDHPDLEAEQNDLKNAGMDTEQVIFRKVFEFEGIWKTMIDQLGLTDIKKALDACNEQCKQLSIFNKDFKIALVSVNFQLGVNWYKKFPKTWKALSEKRYSDAIGEITYKKPGEPEYSDWYKQTPIRVSDFSLAIAKIKEEYSDIN